LSENSEYEDARNEQAQVELRISDLEEQLKNYELIEESGDKKNRVGM
jgi:transcription elongation factor GreA